MFTMQQYLEKPLYKSSFWGQSLSPTDCIIPDVTFPELSLGDWLTFCNMGAYTLSMSTVFNGMPTPHIYYVGHDSERVIIISYFK